MNPNKIITRNLRGAGNLHIPEISKWMQESRDAVHILSQKRGTPLVTFGTDGVQIGGTDKVIQLPPHRVQEGKKYTLRQTIEALGTKEISLNHVGIGYTVDDIDEEVQNLVEQMKRSVHTIYEDPAGREEQMRWLFIGDNTSEDPMCEVVLTDRSNYTRPHMQFDIDTNLSSDEIEEKIEKAFGKGFFDWHLDIPEIGRVLSMGTYDNTNIDMRVGVGTNLRSTKAHRESLIKIS